MSHKVSQNSTAINDGVLNPSLPRSLNHVRADTSAISLRSSINCLAVFAALLLLAACSAKSRGAEMAVAGDYDARENSARFAEEAPQAVYGAEYAPAENAAASAETARRKLVKRATLSLRVENLAKADAAVNALIARHGAYAASADISENHHRYGIRVPARAYTVFLAEMEGMGRILYRSESAEDVTLRYHDLEGRLATKQELLKTYQSYLGTAKNIDEILSVEARIADLQNEIDMTGTEFRGLANLVDYATIDLELSIPAAVSRNGGETLGERIKKLFGGFGRFVSTALVVITGVIMYGIPVVLLLVLSFWLLFGRVGLLKKLLRAAAGKKTNDTEKTLP